MLQLLLLSSFDPVDPSSGQARQLLEQELSRGRYLNQDSMLERLAQWLADLWHRFFDVSLGGGGPAVLLVVVIVLIVALLVWLLPKVRRERRSADAGAAVLEDPTLTADDYRARASSARSDGRHDDALLDAFRAIAVSMSARTLLDGAPGSTAHEISLALGPTFPAHAGTLRSAADRFDAVRYGGEHATPGQADEMLALDRALAAARPTMPSARASAGVS